MNSFSTTVLLFFQTLAWDYIYFIGMAIAYVFVIILVVKTLLQNRNPITTLSWIMVLTLLPFMGLALYFLFGQRIRRRWIFKRMRHKEIKQMNTLSENQLRQLENMDWSDDQYLLEYQKLVSMLLKNNSSFLSSNNHMDVYHSGAAVYNAIYEDLQSATKFIHMQYYLMEDGVVAKNISDILIERSHSGVQVSLVLDGIGSRKLSEDFIKNLQANGVEVLLFRPVRFPNLTNKINNRNHRKILVIDGRIGYTGGINIADKYLAKYGEPGFWRDTHLRIHGDSVKMLEAIFLVDRYYLTQQFFKNLKNYFPVLENKFGSHIQIASSSPESGTANILHAFFTAINTAKKSIRIASPYFIPDESLLMALKTAAMGGVKVVVILPGVMGSHFVQYSARSYVQQLLSNGIHVYFYNKGFIHAKVLIIDHLLSIVGTSNFDYRSFYQNFEISAVVYDEIFARSLIAQFEKDRSDSEKISLSKWRKRPMKNKLLESLARLYAPLI